MHRRHEFTSATKRAARERAGGVCECHRISGMPPCGVHLQAGQTFYEHIDQDFICGDNSLENCAVLTKTCWSIKTNHQDKPRIAKVKRQMDLARDIEGPKFRPLAGTKASGIKIRMGRLPLDRSTGREIGRRHWQLHTPAVWRRTERSRARTIPSF